MVSTEHEADEGPRVVVGIPTQGRRHLDDLLGEIRRQSAHVRIVLAFNGRDEDAERVRRAARAARSEFRISERGYVHPRNCILSAVKDEDVLIFFDDDQYPGPDWLKSMVQCAIQTGADVVMGPVVPLVPKGAWAHAADLRPQFVRAKAGPFQGDPYGGNTLIRLSSLPKAAAFDVRFNLTGGEDTAFLTRLRSQGLRLWMCPDGSAGEYVDKDRVTARGRYARGRALSQRARRLNGWSAVTAGKRGLRAVQGLAFLCWGGLRRDRAIAGRGLFYLGWGFGFFFKEKEARNG